MTRLYECLVEIAKEDGIDQKVKDYLKDAENLHREIIHKYKLWKEFLKRSERFKGVCEWFEEAKQSCPYPAELKKGKKVAKHLEDYLVFASTYDDLQSTSPILPLKSLLPMVDGMRNGVEIFGDMLSESFFSWAITAGFPDEYESEMLMNLFVFGNLHHEPSDIHLFRVIHMIESNRKSNVFKLHEIIDIIFRHVENDENFLNGREPSLQDFKDSFKHFIKSDTFLLLCIFNPYENKDRVKEMIGKLIDERRSLGTAGESSDCDFFDFFERNQFECPPGNVRIDELSRYLQTYDLKQNGKTNREIAVRAYPNYAPEDKDTIRMVIRDRKKAEKIIANVERGFFPGFYQ